MFVCLSVNKILKKLGMNVHAFFMEGAGPATGCSLLHFGCNLFLISIHDIIFLCLFAVGLCEIMLRYFIIVC